MSRPDLRRSRRDEQWLLRFALWLSLLTLGLAGCGGSSSSTTTPIPTGTGVIRLVAPAACNPACTGTELDSVQVTGPQSFAPFTMNFGRVSSIPFAPPGAYTVTGATFVGSTGDTFGCPTVGFTVAAGLTTTGTFAIANDTCSIAVSGPA